MREDIDKLPHFESLFKDLNENKEEYGYAPHKPILLLVVINLFENGFSNRNIPITDALRIEFKAYVKEFQKDHIISSNAGNEILQPLKSLSKDSFKFWQFERNSGESLDTKAIPGGWGEFKKSVEYLAINKNLASLLINPETRKKLKGCLFKSKAFKDAEKAKLTVQKLTKKISVEKQNTIIPEETRLAGFNPVDVQSIKNLEDQLAEWDYTSHQYAPSAQEEDMLAFAQGDAQAGLRLFDSGRATSQEELNKSRQAAEYNGQRGEKLVADYFESRRAAKSIRTYEWTSQKNVTSPYDFRLTDESGIDSLLDVKSTSGDFTSRMYISIREIITMAQSTERYDLYRVYKLSEKGGKLRIASGMRDFAQTILDGLDNLPGGVHVESISVDLKQIESYFGEPIELFFQDNEI